MRVIAVAPVALLLVLAQSPSQSQSANQAPAEAVITGTLRDALGNGIPEVLISAWRRGDAIGDPWGQRPSDLTDDLGNYRIEGLKPGSYIVGTAIWYVSYPGEDFPSMIVRPPCPDCFREPLIDAYTIFRQHLRGSVVELRNARLPAWVERDGRREAFVPSFYPGASARSDAVPIDVIGREMREGADLRLQTLPAAAISGLAIGPHGVGYASVRVRSGGAVVAMTTARDNDTFFFPAVPYGSYEIEAIKDGSHGDVRIVTPTVRARRDVVVDRPEVADVVVSDDPRLTMPVVPVKESPAGSSGIMGNVVDGGSNPVANAIVKIARTADRAEWSTMTNAQGRFVFGGLPEGEFELATAKAGYGFTWFGQRETAPSGQLISLATGERRGDVRLSLMKNAAITGTLRDEAGRPVRARVQAIPPFYPLKVDDARAVTTDDQGRYRISSLRPGEYRIVAADIRDIVSSQAVAYPGTMRKDEAAVLTLRDGETLGGIDFRLFTVPSTTVRVRLADVEGRTIGVAEARLAPEGDINPYGGDSLYSSASESAVKFAGVRAGRYQLTASATYDLLRPSEVVRWGTMSISVDGTTPLDLSLTLDRGASLRGRVEGVEAGTDATKIELHLIAMDPNLGGPRNEQRAYVDASGGFAFKGILPGRYMIAMGYWPAAPDKWAIISSTFQGRDVLDQPWMLSAGQDVEGVLVRISDHASTIDGRVDGVSETSGPAYVVAFSTRSADWFDGSPRLQSARTDQDGHYRLNGLPAGEYFLAVIGNGSRAPGSDKDQAALYSALALRAARVTLGPGEHRTQSLSVK